ncbi:hypothetical protein [Ideonella sp. YS5]|uniref:hypothetical protein n=1 Tax=Ideonella sp. YS5 TaxID=3453714 RepID=UPI003EEC81BB
MPTIRNAALTLVAWGWCAVVHAQAEPAGPTHVIVRPALGGFILGYDIDQAGTTGLLAEAVTLGDGNHDIAVETFDQATGKILHRVRVKRDTRNDYVVFGIFGKQRTGLVEFEHVSDLFVDKRVYWTMDPVDVNDFTGHWTPPLHKADHIITALAPNQGFDETVALGFKNNGSDFASYVFSTNVSANTFGPLYRLDDPVFDWSHSPVIAMDQVKRRAVIGSSDGCFGCSSRIGLVDLDTGTLLSFFGPGLGFLNGIAVDPNTGVACTTSEGDFSVEFYDLDKRLGFKVVLPGATSQAQSGSAVAVDPLHKLFLVGQPISSTAPSGSSIHVYDEKGHLVKSLDGFQLPSSPAFMALKPSERRGFVITAPNLDTLQGFRY